MDSIPSKCIYIDLEVDREIHRIGLVTESQKLNTGSIDSVYQNLKDLRNQGFLICGHNFRRFDYCFLTKYFPDLHPWLIIDTLELSILAFPLEESHKLKKEYKLSEYEGNNPLEDSLATKKLLEKILAVFSLQPQKLLNFYTYLLSCGEDEASQAYCRIFNVDKSLVPDISTLPSPATTGIDCSFLTNFIGRATTSDFNQRLCVAGIIAWNYNSNLCNSKVPLSTWIGIFPECSLILNNLKPLKFPLEFTYQPYLQEFGISEFRSIQEESIQSILEQKNPLILMATGGGKSLCYQLPALMLSHRQKSLTIVISPLQALMADQVYGLVEKGLDFATFINGSLTPTERKERLEQLHSGDKNLLYISPEQLRSPSVIRLLQNRLPSLIVFDEAHCISQWGHDFRPDYRYAPKFISQLYHNQQRELPLMAFMTATATVEVCKDIKSLFSEYQIYIHEEIYSSSIRENLTYQIIPASGLAKENILVEEVRKAMSHDGAVIVYTSTRKKTEELAKLLSQDIAETRFYHGKISKDDKQEILEKFKARELNIIVATCAFGMGIDRSDVRGVIHYSMSNNLEGYIQESGRAGRDGAPATCTLLFDPQDADTIFFLQSLNQLSEVEIRTLFLAIRNLRDFIHGKDKVSEEYFWVTTNEIFQASDLDSEFGTQEDQRDTKIKVALNYLEAFGMVERQENQSSFIEFNLIDDVPKESLEKFDLFAHVHNLPVYRINEFHRLILAMHLAKAYCENQDEPYPLEKLSDDSGLVVKELRKYIRELQKAEVCTLKAPITLLITKGVVGAAESNYKKLQNLEQQIIDKITNLLNNQEEIQINCRALATCLDPTFQQKLSSKKILSFLEGWKLCGWIEYQRIRNDIIKITRFDVVSYFANQQSLIEIIINIIYEKIGKKTGTRLRVEQDLNVLLSEINQRIKPQILELEELNKALAWMHLQKLIRIADGLNLFQQSMKVKVVKGAREDRIVREYPIQIRPHYDEQVYRTHIMIEYGQKSSQLDSNLQEYIANYFSLPKSQFYTKNPNIDEDFAKLPVTQADYARIISKLNPVQKEIVKCNSPAISVIAGPGSGKTLTIVHRIAYLVKVKRVDPARIITLAYNRNAVSEIRVRLQDLIGEMASRLRVYTFHGLALSILGRTVEPTKKELQDVGNNANDLEKRFSQLIKDAYTFLTQDEDGQENEYERMRIVATLGKCEYIFVDEYQDIAKDEYCLVKTIAGLQKSEDNSYSTQTNICIIGDDDQNIYQFRGTSTEFIRSFQAEYQAQQFLLTENYRSTESIINASNRLIGNNNDRLKNKGDEQVRIDNVRTGQKGIDVYSLKFTDDNHQAEYIKRQVKKWINKDGIKPGEIAILAKTWQYIDKARALLERRANIRTYSLKGQDIRLIRNYVTQLLISYLESNPNLIISKDKSVKSYFVDFFEKENRSLLEPTVKTLMKIAEDIDKERGYANENISCSISVSEIITSVYEFNESPDNSINEEAVLVTSCHGAKGLEFKHVILIADGFDCRKDKIESERRLFYVAMTRAREKLILTYSQESQLISETKANSTLPVETMCIEPLKSVFYADLSPYGSLVKDGGDINLGYIATKSNQDLIKKLKEGAGSYLKENRFGNNWGIFTSENIEVGELSRKALEVLKSRGIILGEFQFQDGDVTVRNIYRHLKTDEINGNILEDWYVIIPEIRICR